MLTTKGVLRFECACARGGMIPIYCRGEVGLGVPSGPGPVALRVPRVIVSRDWCRRRGMGFSVIYSIVD